jgi:hypothetical protein
MLCLNISVDAYAIKRELILSLSTPFSDCFLELFLEALSVGLNI